MKIFKRRVKTFLGQTVYYGDTLCFINSDGEHCSKKLEYNKKTRKLFFWNNSFPVTAYHSLKKCDCLLKESKI